MIRVGTGKHIVQQAVKSELMNLRERMKTAERFNLVGFFDFVLLIGSR